MRFFTSVPGAFREGFVNSTLPRGRKILMWSVLAFLWFIAALTFATSIFAFVYGFTIQGFTFAIQSVTFVFLSITVVHNSSLYEARKRSSAHD